MERDKKTINGFPMPLTLFAGDSGTKIEHGFGGCCWGTGDKYINRHLEDGFIYFRGDYVKIQIELIEKIERDIFEDLEFLRLSKHFDVCIFCGSKNEKHNSHCKFLSLTNKIADLKKGYYTK